MIRSFAKTLAAGAVLAPMGLGMGLGLGARQAGIPAGDGGGGAGGAPTGADVQIRGVRKNLTGSTGTMDFTVPGFGTPKAALFFVTLAATNDAVQSYTIYGVGGTDGTRQWSHCFFSLYDVATTDTKRVTSDADVLSYITGAYDVRAQFSSWITDGIRINVSQNSGSRTSLVTCILFGGSDLTAYATTVAQAALDADTIVTPGFEVNALLAFNGRRPANEVVFANQANLSLGFASYDGATIRQNGFVFGAQDNAAASYPFTRLIDGGMCPLEGPVYDHLELNSITSTTFKLKTKTNTVRTGESDVTGVLALGLANGGKAWTGVVDVGTSTGSVLYNGADFLPVYAFAIPNLTEAADAFYSNTDVRAGSFGFSMIGASEQFFHGAMEDGGADPTRNYCISSDKPLRLYDDAGSALQIAGTFNAFGTGGVTLDITAAPSATKKMPILFIG